MTDKTHTPSAPDKKVRTRFAPSPTGYMHIGNLRTALYTFLFARHNGGSFILRIEDTDQERLVPGSMEIIYKTLHETGLNYDEGPDVGGSHGPYIQTERRDIYQKYIKELIDLGGAYHCFCTKERLAELKEQQTAAKVAYKYDGHCRSVTAEQAAERIAKGEPSVVRQKIPAHGTSSFEDAIFGTVTVSNSELDDSILIKSDGLPTYNFANVIDDHLMEITHVIRGTEYLSSAPKYNLIYNAFGWQVPQYVHLSPIMKTSSQKLSKRDGDPSYEDLLKLGYIKEAIINYISLLGWNPKSVQEFFTLDELIAAFDLHGLQKSPAIFDMAKLRWFNQHYLQQMPLAQFAETIKPFLPAGSEHLDLMKIAETLHQRTEVLGEISAATDFLAQLPEYSADLYTNAKMKTTPQTALTVLQKFSDAIPDAKSWTAQEVQAITDKIMADLQFTKGQTLWPIRIALAGKQFSPGGAIEIAEIFGPAETKKRVSAGIAKL